MVAFWLRHGREARRRPATTARSSRCRPGCSASGGLRSSASAEQLRAAPPGPRLGSPDERQWALLSGLWEGDGSWSLVNGGPSVILELGTVSDELADGVLRLLGDLGIVASRRIGRTAKSTKDTHWLRISGADQVERAASPGARARPARRPGEHSRCSQAHRADRVAPLRRRSGVGAGHVDRRGRIRGHVYSLEVPGAHHVRVHRRHRHLATAFPRTSPRSSSSPATPATTSSCSPRSSRSTSCRSGA